MPEIDQNLNRLQNTGGHRWHWWGGTGGGVAECWPGRMDALNELSGQIAERQGGKTSSSANDRKYLGILITVSRTGCD